MCYTLYQKMLKNWYGPLPIVYSLTTNHFLWEYSRKTTLQIWYIIHVIIPISAILYTHLVHRDSRRTSRRRRPRSEPHTRTFPRLSLDCDESVANLTKQQQKSSVKFIDRSSWTGDGSQKQNHLNCPEKSPKSPGKSKIPLIQIKKNYPIHVLIEIFL